MTDVIEINPDSISVSMRTFRLTHLNLSSTGMFDGEVNAYGPLRSRWVSTLQFTPMEDEHWIDWDGIISAVGGVSGSIRCVDPARRMPYFNRATAPTSEAFSDGTFSTDGSGFSEGRLPSTAVVSGACARGSKSLIIDGLPASLSLAFRRGDTFEIRPNGLPASFGHYYIITKNANTDANGSTRVEFVPGLRAGVANGDMVVLSDPKTTFRFTSDDVGEMQVTPPFTGSFSLSLTEVLPRL